MKKSIFSIFTVTALLFTACGDNGSTTEIAENRGEVNPNHLNDYGDQPARSGGAMDEGDAQMMHMQRAENIASRMASDLQLDRDKQDQVQQVIYDREVSLAELDDIYNYSETARMGGETDNDTYADREMNAQRDMNQNTDMDANRENNDPNTMPNPVASENAMTESEMNTERDQIMSRTDNELREILSAEEYRSYEQNKENYHSMGQGSMNNGNGNMNNDNTSSGNNQ